MLQAKYSRATIPLRSSVLQFIKCEVFQHVHHSIRASHSSKPLYTIQPTRPGTSRLAETFQMRKITLLRPSITHSIRQVGQINVPEPCLDSSRLARHPLILQHPPLMHLFPGGLNPRLCPQLFEGRIRIRFRYWRLLQG